MRPPFYSQCFVAAPFALALSLAGQVWRIEIGMAAAAGAALFVVALVWYGVIETRWFRTHLQISTGRAAITVILTLGEGFLLMFLTGIVVVYGFGSQ